MEETMHQKEILEHFAKEKLLASLNGSQVYDQRMKVT